MAPKIWKISDYHVSRLPLVLRKAIVTNLLAATDSPPPSGIYPEQIPVLTVHFCIHKNLLGYSIDPQTGNPS